MNARPFAIIAAAATTAITLAGGTAASATANPASIAPTPAAVTAKASDAVARVDVDGDGRRDTVTITPTKIKGEPGQVLRVTTAKGRRASASFATPWLFGEKPWFGASHIDGVKGAELVVTTGFGAHTQFQKVYSWRNNRLVALKDPSSGSTQWWIDGALSISQGYQVTTYRGAKALVVQTYETDLSARKPVAKGVVTTYTWGAKGWNKARTVTRTVAPSAPEVSKAIGWKAVGLPTF